jgi:uncharacterized surface protein with fasciclin (FAS1) repeats
LLEKFMRKLTTMLFGAALFAVATPTVSQAQEKDIVETAVAAGSFNTLAQALTAAGLIETLKGPGPFTVFAPTDEAFAKVPKATLDALLADKEALKAVLLYHVVPGKVMAADAIKLDGKSAKMASGAEAKVSVMGGTVMVNQAHVTQADIAAKNGVIHVIDAVILPPKADN